MSKKFAAKIGCGNFDQLNLQALNDYNFFFFKTFSTIYYIAPNAQIFNR